MKAIVIVVVAVATLLGLGWYFSNTQVHAPAPVAATADMHPEKDGAQFQHSGPAANVAEGKSNSYDSKINFDHSQLPDSAGRDRHALGSNKKNEWNDDRFPMPDDENEVVGRYVHRKMVYPKDPSIAKNVKMNDDLLIMEEHSEDRLSATR